MYPLSLFYNFLSHLRIYRPQPAKLLLVGLPNAGQSTLLRYFAENLGHADFNVAEPLTRGNVVISALDLGTGSHDTSNHQNMDDIRMARGVVFLVDVTARDGHSWDDVRRQLHALEARLKDGVPILVLGDGFDSPGAGTSRLPHQSCCRC